LNLAYNLTSSKPSFFDDADAAFAQLKADLVSAQWLELAHGDVERHIAPAGLELMRRLFQAHLTLRGEAEPQTSVVGRDRIERTHKRKLKARLLETTFGTVVVERTAFACRGVHALHPVDADLNLPLFKHSHEVQRLAAYTAARQSFESSAECVTTMTAAIIGKRQLESIVGHVAVDFDAFYSSREFREASLRPTGPLLIISIDQKGVVMLPDHLTPETRNIARALRKRLPAVHDRDGKDHWRGKKRMATVATVYTIDPDDRSAEDVVRGLRRNAEPASRPVRTVRPQMKRVWASLERAPGDVVDDAFAEAKKRDPENAKRWVVLIDGDPDLERWVAGAADRHGVDVTLGLDIIHALQYLWRAGETLCGKGSQSTERWVLDRLLNILQGNVSNTIAGITRSATLRGLKPHQRREVDRCCTYLISRKHMLTYDQLLAWGAPIATGAVEGACKHLINDRLQICGARWTISGAEALLRIRAIVISGDYDEYWKFHEAAEYERNHASLYARGTPPPVCRQARRRRHLAVVRRPTVDRKEPHSGPPNAKAKPQSP